MNPHDHHAPGLPRHHQSVIHRRPHIAIFRGNDIIRCSCGKLMEGDGHYRDHLQTKVSYESESDKKKKGR